MKREFGHLRWNKTEKTFATAIDEYNFVIAHNQKNKKRSRSPQQKNRGDGE
jgi:hypothetical protein